jgi:hypothetical protein
MFSLNYREVVCPACGHHNRRFGPLVDRWRYARYCDVCSTDLETGKVGVPYDAHRLFRIGIAYLCWGLGGGALGILAFGLGAMDYRDSLRQPGLWSALMWVFGTTGVACGLAFAESMRRKGILVSEPRTRSDTPAERQAAREETARSFHFFGGMLAGAVAAFPLGWVLDRIGYQDWTEIVWAVGAVVGAVCGMAYGRVRRQRGDFR